MLSKKHHITIAKIFNETRKAIIAVDSSEYAAIELSAISTVVDSLKTYFKRDNPALDEDQFHKAVYEKD
mgnify:CR=1 FL=1